MHLHRTDDAATFLNICGGFLMAHEALLNLPFAIARQCIEDPERYRGRNYFAAAEGSQGIEGVALMTPPHRLQAFMKPDAVALVVQDLVENRWPVPGVTGPQPDARTFAAAWCHQHPLRAECRHRLRAFQLTAVTPSPSVPGAMRRAGSADRATVEEWYRAFDADADLAIGEQRATELAGRALGAGRLFVWDHEGAVAQAAINGTTTRGVRIGMVYTPPSHRRHGYATALVAALSRHGLAAGSAFCFLFTNLANPISNSIYPKIGYRPVADFEEIDFVPAM
jgi:predicted GNAT family acetyltransferase